MSRSTTPAQMAFVALGLVTGTTIIFFLVGLSRLALIGLTLLVAACLALLLDLRRRSQVLGRHVGRITANVERVEASCASADERARHHTQAAVAEVSAALDEVATSIQEVTVSVGNASTGMTRESEQALSRHRAEMNHLRQLMHQPVTQVQALSQLRDRLGRASERLPLLGGWAIDPSTMLFLVDHITSNRPGLIVECGSGSSTAWMAEILRQVGEGRLVAVEHDEAFVASSRARLDALGLAEYAEIRHAPLVEAPGGFPEFRWYDPSALEDLAGIDLLVIDGPPTATGALARYPALPILSSRLAPQTTIVLDDARRADERSTVERWEAEGYISAEKRTLHSAVVLSRT